jgi:hypothetical protein
MDPISMEIATSPANSDPAPVVSPSRTFSHPNSSTSRVRHPRGTGDGGAGGAPPRPGNRRAHDSGGEGDGGRSLADGTTWHVGCEPRLPALPLAAYAMRGVARRGWTAHRSPTR